MTNLQRKSIVAEALSWARTPYHDHGAVKGAGADCALYPLAVYSSVLALPDIPLPRYVEQWHLHRSEELYLNHVRALGAVEVEAPQPGDFALFHIGRVYSHGAIVLDWPQIVHAVKPRGVILADALIESKLIRSNAPPLFFTFPE